MDRDMHRKKKARIRQDKPKKNRRVFSNGQRDCNSEKDLTDFRRGKTDGR